MLNPTYQSICVPCTAATPSSMDSDQACPINDYRGCNELLFDIGIELREQRGGSLSLVCFRTGEPKVTPPRQSNLDRSIAFVRWLLRTYVCINGLKLQRKWVTAHIRIIQELPENSRLTRLKLECPRGDSVQADFAALWITNILLAAISALLMNTMCLTSLIFRVCFVKDQLPQTFMNALAANTTLKYLELWVNFNIPKTRERVRAYVRSNRLLTNMHLFGVVTNGNEFLLLEALVCNYTFSVLHIIGLESGANSARFLTSILTDCTSLKKLTIDGLAAQYVISEATQTHCVEALAGNGTLEKLHLSYSLWRPTHGIVFVGFLPENKRLKKLDIFRTLFCDYESHRPVLEALKQTDSSGRVFFGCLTHKTPETGHLHFHAFSGVKIHEETNAKVNALQCLPSFDHFTSVTLGLFESDQRLFNSAAKYIRATTMLRKLSLLVTNPASEVPSSCWVLLFESISSNTSMTDLSISGSDDFSYTGHLARTVAVSTCITRASYAETRPEWSPNGPLLALSRTLGENYNLFKVYLSNLTKMDAEARRCWFTVMEVTGRNSGLVKWAGAVIISGTLEWYTANALEKVSRCLALVKELAEKEGIAVDDVARMLRSRLVSVDGMHDFMRLTGVVKTRVTCAPAADGFSFQIEDLNDDCWRLVRRYLSFDDVKRFIVTRRLNDNHG